MTEPLSRPPVRTRLQWRAKEPKGPPRYTRVTHLVVHHTESPNSTPDWEEKVRFIERLHTKHRGWSDIAYNYLIAPDGTIYEGRAGGDNVRGTHCRNLNDNTMAVAMLGKYDDVPPSEQAVDSLVRLLAWKCAKSGLDPLAVAVHPASGRELPIILGHRDGDPRRGCPGDKLYELLPAIRTRTSELLSGG